MKKNFRGKEGYVCYPFYATELEFKRLEAAANAVGLNATTYIRHALMTADLEKLKEFHRVEHNSEARNHSAYFPKFALERFNSCGWASGAVFRAIINAVVCGGIKF